MSLYAASDLHSSLTLSEATLTALELPQQPFGALEPNAASFNDEITAEQIADVKQALITGDDLLLILGDEGAGKTVMLKQLGEQSGNRIQSFAVKGSERFSTMNLFTGLLEAFKHSPPEKLQDILNDLIPYLQTMITRNTLSVIVLDDAHKVRDHELTQLLSAMLYINSHDENVMRIAMAAPEEFEARIPDLLPRGADLPYSSLMISGLSAPRAAEFLDFRLQEAGLRGEPPFTEPEIQELVDRSGGLPGPLQIAAVGALNQQYGPMTDDIEQTLVSNTGSSGFLQSRFSKMALGTLAVFCIALGVLMSLPGRDNDEAGRYTVSRTEPITLNDSDADAELRLVEETSNSTSDQSGDATSSNPAVVFENDNDTDQNATESNATIASGSTNDASSNNNGAENVLTVSTAPITADTTVDPVENRPIVIVEAPTEADNVAETVAPSTDDSNTAIQEPAPAPVEQEPVQAAVSATNNQNSSGSLESSSWILLQDRKLYTVQMSASRDRNAVIGFLESHADALSGPNSIYSFNRNGSDWFALLHGLYGSIEEARRAVETMPPEALKNQPWIRSVARVQDVLKAQ